MPASDYLLPIVTPATHKGVFNEIEYEFGFSGINTATFDTTSINGHSTVIINSTMATLINVNDFVLIGGSSVISQYKGQKKVLQKITLSGTSVRLELDNPYSGTSPSGTIIPLAKQTFKIWAGFQGEGSSTLNWQERDSMSVSPDKTTLTYKFQVQSFLKKYFSLITPIVGIDYNISLKYAVTAGVAPFYANSLNGYYGFTNPDQQQIVGEKPLGDYPINYVNKSTGLPLPVIHSQVENIEFNLMVNPFFDQGLTSWTQTDQFSGVSFVDIGGGKIRATSSPSTDYTDILNQDITVPNISSLFISVICDNLLSTGWSDKLVLWVKLANTTVYLIDIQTINIQSVFNVNYTLTSAAIGGAALNTIDLIGIYFRKTASPTTQRIWTIDQFTVSTSQQSSDRLVKNILTKSLPLLITSSSYSFDALADNEYTLVWQHSGAIGSLNVTPALPSWITIESSPSNQIILKIRTNTTTEGDYESIDYSSTDYDTLSVNSVVGCYLFQFKDGANLIFTLEFCVWPISETIEVCEDDVINLAYLNNSGGYNSIALPCTFVNGREFGSDSTFKTSSKLLKRSQFEDVYDTITLSASVLSRRTLDLLKALRSSVHALLYNDESQAFDIPVVIEKSNVTTYGNKFRQSNTRVSMTIKKAQEVLIQTQ